MTEKFDGIVLDVTRHTDRHNIVTLYTRARGRIAFISAAGGGREGRLRQSRLMPLAVIGGDFNFKANAELQRLNSFSLSTVWSDIYFDPVKQVMALFLSEFLNKLLRATMPDEALWDFLVRSFGFLDSSSAGVNDFHILFLSSLLPYAGIQPDPEGYCRGMVFDMQAGQFVSSIPSHRDWVGGDSAALAARLFGARLGDTFTIDTANRREALRILLHYYGLHYPGTSNLKSLPVLHEIFSS